MKKIKLYGLIALFAGFSTLADAARPIPKSYVGLWAEGAEWSLLTKNNAPENPDAVAFQLNNSVGGAGGAGVCYDLQVSHFILNLGVGARYGYTQFNAPDCQQVLDLVDKDAQRLDYTYTFSERKDSYSDLSLRVPVLLGGQWGRFYFLTGVKLGYSLLTNSNIKALATTTGQYYGLDANGIKQPMFELYQNMPDRQFYNDQPMQKKGKTNFNLDLAASLEIGARLGFVSDHTGYDVPKTKVQYRLAAFVDYGFLDIHKAKNLPAVTAPAANFFNETDDSMIRNIQINDVLSTPIVKATMPLVVGLKFTVLFEMPKRRDCVLCRDGYQSLAKPYKSGGKIEE